MTALVIANTQIRCDAAGRYCLNDLHQASGGAKRHQPSDWLRLKQTQELIAEVISSPDELRESPELNPVETSEGRYGGGTYAVKELVYAYAMWISAAFHLHVIRAYDALVAGRAAAEPPPVPVAATHRADVLVSATRTFAALARAGRTLRMGHARALAAANAATFRATGIDLIDELGAHDLVAEPALGLPDGLPPGLADWLAGRDLVTTRDVITGLSLGNPDDTALQMRAAAAMRALGWTKVRSTRTARQWAWQRPAVATTTTTTMEITP